MIVNIPLFGPHQQAYSKTVDNQSTINFFYEQAGDRVALHGTPGLLEFADTGGGANRGHGEFGGSYFAINGTSLYQIAADGAVATVGSIAGAGQCKLVDTGSDLVITTGSTPYAYDGSTLTTISGLNDPNTAAYLNQRTYFDGAGGHFQAGSLGDPTTIDALDTATAESAPDDTVGVYVHKQNLLMGGQKSIEPWYNSGVGMPPVDRINGGIQPYGVAAVHSVATNADFVYFLSHEREPIRLNGLTAEQIGTTSIINEWRSFSTVSDAIGFCYTINGARFWEITFPTENKTYAYQENVGMWLRLQSGQGRHKTNGAHYIYNKWLAPDYSNGKIYELDLETYTDDGATIERERSTVHLHAGLLGGQFAGREVTCNWLELTLESGVGLATGQGQDPTVMMTYSDDGKIWSHEMWMSAGVMGAYNRRVIWYDLGVFVNRQFRFRVSDPVKWSFVRLSADVEVGI